MNDSDLTVEGYRFNSASDATAAREELKRIAYIEAHINFDDPENVLTIYDKVIINRIFVTPIGYDFMKKIQKFLMDSPAIEKDRIRALPLSNMYTLEQQMKETPVPQPKVIPQKKREQLKDKLFVSVVLNVVLIIAMIAMFVIVKSSDNPNILNYKTAIENKYASWEEELKAREQTVREKEQELNIYSE